MSVLQRFLASQLKIQQNGLLNVNVSKPRDIQNAYNSVLTACAYTPSDAGMEHRTNAADILVQCLRDMNQFPWSNFNDGGRGSGSSRDGSSSNVITTGPNQETYALFMQGCSHLYESNSTEQLEFCKGAFRECCEKGLLNEIIWDKFRVVMGSKELVDVFLRDFIPPYNDSHQKVVHSEYADLPEEWKLE